jgi:hypothetical protein
MNDNDNGGSGRWGPVMTMLRDARVVTALATLCTALGLRLGLGISAETMGLIVGLGAAVITALIGHEHYRRRRERQRRIEK